MRRRSIPFALALFALGCATAQPRSGSGARLRQPALVYTVDGRVLGTDTGSAPSPDTTVRVILQPDGAKPIVVELAPGWYLDRRGLHFSERQRLQIEGHREGTGDNGTFVARFELRDESGAPVWSSSERDGARAP
jgi:hypothetical protein